jgi:hypothetical protein
VGRRGARLLNLDWKDVVSLSFQVRGLTLQILGGAEPVIPDHRATRHLRIVPIPLRKDTQFV